MTEENNSDMPEYPIEYLPGEICYSKGAVKELRSTILMHPELYELIENYKNQTPLQRFAWNIKWGFKDCLDNFRNWQGHMRGGVQRLYPDRFGKKWDAKDWGANTPIVPDETMEELLKNGVKND